LVANIFVSDRQTLKSVDVEIYKSLVFNAQTQDVSIRKAALLCLNYVGEILNQTGLQILSQDEQDQMLGTVFQSLKEYSPLTMEALRAAKFSTQYIGVQMKDPQIV
jgi:hypothetical protein